MCAVYAEIITADRTRGHAGAGACAAASHTIKVSVVRKPGLGYTVTTIIPESTRKTYDVCIVIHYRTRILSARKPRTVLLGAYI